MTGMSAPARVRFHFDFISPYSWLALMEADAFAERHRVSWEPRPVVYGALLDATGLIGPAEVDIKRRYTFHDVARCAAQSGLRLVGPPAHPFRSLEALRTACLFVDEPRAIGLCARLAHAAWGQGRDLTDLAVLAEVVGESGFDATGLGQRIVADEVKLRLRRYTEQALADGVFGVPSFLHDGELFWGHDRMTLLAEHVAGRLAAPPADAERMLARPRGVDRKRRPPA
jgi:2-hydroxychromene-2-carboxylate isomerase